MSDNKIKWEIKSSRSISTKIVGKVGKWILFEHYYDSLRSKGDSLTRKLKCFLPGIKHDLGNFETVKEAEKKAQNVCAYWFQKLKE